MLDEATSALDTETEREIQRALAELAKGRSSLSIAHRLSTIINSDQIVVMKDGQVVEQGGYKELIDQGGAFATMWKKQIFTEAEMVAQLESGSSTGDPIKLAAEDSKAPSRQISKEKMKAVQEDVEEAVKEILEPSKGFQVGVESTQPEGVSDDIVEPKPTSRSNPTDAINPFINSDSDDSPEPTANVSPTLSPSAAAPAPAPSPIPPPESVETPITQPSTLPSINTSPERSSPVRSISPGPFAVTGAAFPPMPRMTSSTSQRSDLSTHAVTGGPQTESPSASSTDLPEAAKEDKRRKRLSSLKGFVRRISDQGVSRSNSLKGLSQTSGTSKGGEEADEATALIGKNISAGSTPQGEEKRKKRLSLVRGKSDK